MDDMDEYMRCLDRIALTNHIEDEEPTPGLYWPNLAEEELK